MPDSIARICHIGVGLVLDPWLGLRHQVGLKICVPHVQKRPDDDPALRIDPSQACQPSAAHELEKKRLRLVVLGVSDRDSVGSDQCRRTLQERITKATTGVLGKYVKLVKSASQGCVTD